jgi:hypothetical protein
MGPGRPPSRIPSDADIKRTQVLLWVKGRQVISFPDEV